MGRNTAIKRRASSSCYLLTPDAPFQVMVEKVQATVLRRVKFCREMGDDLWSEKTCTSLISALPLWIIEHAWSERMVDVLEVLGPPPWLEGDWGRLTLKGPCSIRVVAAESWMIVKIRDIKQFERVMSFLDVTYTLLPHLVTPIKHMKIMFGLKTLVIMWLLWENQARNSIDDKVTKLFPDILPQYHQSNRKHMHLMQKTQQDFRIFAESLASNQEMRKTYIRDSLEQQYGERYAMKLEERLLHYLEELDKALPQSTYIDQVLKQSGPVRERKLLHQLLTSKSVSLPTALKRLLRCAMTTHHNPDSAHKKKNEPEGDRPDPQQFCVAFRPSQELAEEEKLSQVYSQRSWLDRDKSPSLLQRTCEDGGITMTKMNSVQSPVLPQDDRDLFPLVEQHPHPGEVGEFAETEDAEDELPKNLCSRHGKKMNTILLECSDEFKGQDSKAHPAHAECTPPSPHPPLFQSTPDRLQDTSASSLQDSSSTNISLFSHPDSSSTNISVSEVPQLTSSLSFPLQQSASVQQIKTTSEFSAQSLFSLFPKPTTQQTSPISSMHAPLSHTPSSLGSFSSPAAQVIVKSASSTAHCISPPSSSSLQQDSSSHIPSFQQINSPNSLDSRSCPLSSSTSSSTHLEILTQSRNAVQVSDMMGKNLGTINTKPRLSSDTQNYLLLCRWMQPQVLLCRLSQQECAFAKILSDRLDEGKSVEERHEYESFDVNVLYSDSHSESDTRDSDDPDYLPSKKFKV